MGRKSIERREGFTLLEVMTVVAVLGILAVFAWPSAKRMQNGMAAKASASQVAGLLSNARERALAEGTPHLVYFNTADAPASGENGGCAALATEVRDADHSYSITPGDTATEFSLPSESCGKVKQYGEPADPASPVAAVPLPNDDMTKRAADAVATVAADASGDAQGEGEDNSGSGNGKGPKATPPAKPEKPAKKAKRSATVAETVVNGTTFPVDASDGRPVIAFSERGIPVDPSNPTEWGAGAGGLYLTDGESTVVAAIVGTLGDIQLRVFDPGSSDWR